MNEYLQAIYKERCAEAERAANALQNASRLVALRFHELSKNGLSYSSVDRRRDADDVVIAQKAFEAALAAVLQVEEDDRTR